MTPWLLLSAASVAFLAFLVSYVLRRPPAPILFRPLTACLVAALLFSFGDAITLWAPQDPSFLLGVCIQYAGAALLGPSMLLLALRFAEASAFPFSFGNSPWSNRLFLVTALHYLAFATNPIHGQFLTLVPGDRNEYHWMWWIATGSQHLLGMSSVLAFIILATRLKGLARSRCLTLLTAIAVTLLANSVYILLPVTLPFDPSIPAAATTGALMVAGVYGTRLFALSPLAANTVMHQLKQGLLLIDLDGRLIQANLAARELVGPDALPLNVAIYPVLAENLKDSKQDAAPLLAEDLKEQIEAPTPPKEGLLYRFGGSQSRWMRIHVTAIESARGKLVGRCLQLEDQTVQREQESQLRQSQKMEALGQLTGGVAHDFNNVIMLMQGNAEFLLESVEGPQRQAAEQLLKAAERAQRLTRQLLAFSRRQFLNPEPIALSAVVAELDSLFERTLGETITVELDLDASGHVTADPGQMDQLVLNLAINARDAMPDGGTLRITTSELEVLPGSELALLGLPPGQCLRLRVSDTGIGMSEELMARAFEPFFTTKSVGRGTGLGLSTVHGIVQQAKGSITLNARAEGGTLAEVHLPMSEPGKVSEPKTEFHSSQPAQSATLLVAEDERNLRSLIVTALRRSGHHVLEASDGLEALEIAEKYEGVIDALLSDVVMPRMSGAELAERLRLVRPDVKVIFLTGHPGRPGAPLELPAHDLILEKPIRPRRLAARIQTILQD